jgi:hypothetical protein
MPDFRYAPGCGELRRIKPKAKELGGEALIFLRKPDARNGQDSSFFAPMSEWSKIRRLTIREAILLYVTSRTGFQ